MHGCTTQLPHARSHPGPTWHGLQPGRPGEPRQCVRCDLRIASCSCWSAAGERQFYYRFSNGVACLQNYEGVKGPIRKAVTEVSREAYEQFLRGDTKAIPAWMQISDSDGPKAREKKARALKAFKKKLRCGGLHRQRRPCRFSIGTQSCCVGVSWFVWNVTAGGRCWVTQLRWKYGQGCNRVA